MSDPQVADHPTSSVDLPSPSVSDEKMDTASESFPSSQHTPNTPSEDHDDVDKQSIPLQNAEDHKDSNEPGRFSVNYVNSHPSHQRASNPIDRLTNADNYDREDDDDHYANRVDNYMLDPADSISRSNNINNGYKNEHRNGEYANPADNNIGVLRLANPVEGCIENDNDRFSLMTDDFIEDTRTLLTESTTFYEDTSDVLLFSDKEEHPERCITKDGGEILDNANNVPHENIEYQRSDNFERVPDDPAVNKSASNESNEDINFTRQTSVLNETATSKPLRLGNIPPKLTSTLTLTDDHPLMGLSSPESPPLVGNYPDLILQSRKGISRDELKNSGNKINDTGNFLNSDYSGMLSLSSTEDESFNRSIVNGDVASVCSDGFSNQDGPQRNTSKNNLYFSDNFTSSEGNRSIESSSCSDDLRNSCNTVVVDCKLAVSRMNYKKPDVLETSNSTVDSVKVVERRKIKPDIKAPKIRSNTCIVALPRMEDNPASYRVLGRDLPVRNSASEGKITSGGTQNKVADDSDFSQLRTFSNYELPIEVPSNFPAPDEVPSPDSCSSSSTGKNGSDNSRSLYLAEVDPVGGRAALKPRPPSTTNVVPPTRRKIIPIMTETDTESCPPTNPLDLHRRTGSNASSASLDSLSGCSLRSDEEGVAVPLKEPEGTPNRCAVTSDDDYDCSDTETETDGERRSSDNRCHESEDCGGGPEKIPEYSLSEERNDARRWLKVTLPAGERRTIDMKVIEPYKRVLSHGGYAMSGRRDAIVVFSACFLPDSSRVDYNYVMDNLFLYVLTTLEQLVTDDYILIYLHGSAAKRSMPTFHWLKKCYQLVDRRLRKSLKHLYLVHPTFWLKSIMWMTRPFISSKFSRKLSYVHTLDELSTLVPVEPASIPEPVRKFDAARAT